MFEFAFTYILPVAVYILFVTKYVSYRENENNKIPFK